MQNVDLYCEFNKSDPNKFKDMEELLKEHKNAFRWFSEEVVLDVGCGPGDVTRHVVYPWLPEKVNKTVLGVDVSPAMKDVGNKQFSNQDVSFETFDISAKDLDIILENKKYRNGFSKIFSFFVFHWISDLEMAFRNVYKLLRPQGQVLLYIPVSRTYQRLYKQMQEKEPWSTLLKGVDREIPNYFLGEDPASEFLSIVKKAGFKVISCQCVTKQEKFSLDVLKKLIGSLDIHFNKIPTHLKERYLEECVEIMMQNSLKELDDGNVILSEKRITAFLEK